MATGNRGNTRTGHTRNVRGRRRGQLAWRDDVVILARMNVGFRLIWRGLSADQRLRMVNEWCRSMGCPTIGARQLAVDQAHFFELTREEFRAKAAKVRADIECSELVDGEL